MLFERGQEIGNYIVESSKSGGMGIVYFVRTKEEYPQKFVLKTFRPDLMKNTRIQIAFLREAEYWIRLSAHPNIVMAQRILEVEGQLYILAEKIAPNEKLGCVSALEWLKIRPIWPLEGIKYGVQICRAMHWAQKQIPGFIHRDIKPGNLLITGGRILVNDFGLGGVAYEIAQSELLSNKKYSMEWVRGGMSIWGKRAVGTIEYMAPEVIKEEGASIRSDIYSFGATLYHMLSGRLVFTGTPKKIAYAHLHENPIPLRRIVNNIPLELDAIVMKCMFKSSKDRFADFRELGVALQEVYTNLTGHPVMKNSDIGTNKELLQDWSQSLKKLGKNGRAEELINWAGRSRNPDTLCATAEVLINQRKLTEAAEILREAVKFGFTLYINLEYPYLLLAVALVNLEEYGELHRVVREALKIAPDNSYLIAYHGFALLMLDKVKEAKIEFKKAQDLKPNDSDIAATVGLAWMKYKNMDESEKWYRKAIKHNPKNLSALFNLALICENKALFTDAITLWQQFLEIAPPDDPFFKEAKDHFERISTKYNSLKNDR